jgi:hypothetical protein
MATPKQLPTAPGANSDLAAALMRFHCSLDQAVIDTQAGAATGAGRAREATFEGRRVISGQHRSQ